MAHFGQKACLRLIRLGQLSSHLLEVTHLLPELPCLLFHFLLCAPIRLEKLGVPAIERIAKRIDRRGEHPQNRIEGAKKAQRKRSAQHLVPVGIDAEAAEVSQRPVVLVAQPK